MEFTLLGRKIEMSEGKRNYLSIIADFTQMADRAVKGFNSDFANLLLEKYSENALNHYYEDYVSETRKYLAKYGVFTLPESKIWEAITTEYDGETALQNKLTEVMHEILEDVPNYESEQDQLLWCLKKIISKINAGYFDIEVRIDVMAMCDFVIGYLVNNDISDVEFVYKDDAEKAKMIYQNLVEGNVPDLDKEVWAYSLIELDFSERRYYTYLFESFPQAKFEIAAITNYLGIDISDFIEKDIKRSFDLKTISCESEAIEMMTELQKVMEKYQVTKSSRKTALEQLLRDFDVQARTYDGVRYDTRELRAKAESDDKEIATLYSDNLDKSEYLEIIKVFEGKPYDEGIKNKHISIIHKKIQGIEKAELERLIEGLVTATETQCAEMVEKIENYDAVVAQKDSFIERIQKRVKDIWKTELDALVDGLAEMDENSCNKAKECLQAHCAPNDMKTPYVESVDKRIYSIWDAEDFTRFAELYTKTSPSDQEQKNKVSGIVLDTGRTETKNLFYGAICFLNENDIEAAAKYALAKEKGTFASLLNMGKKDTYEILTLQGRVMHPAILNAMDAIKSQKGNGILAGFGFGRNKAKQQAVVTPNGNEPKFCSACGAKIDAQSKFCSSCGNKVN